MGRWRQSAPVVPRQGQNLGIVSGPVPVSYVVCARRVYPSHLRGYAALHPGQGGYPLHAAVYCVPGVRLAAPPSSSGTVAPTGTEVVWGEVPVAKADRDPCPVSYAHVRYSARWPRRWLPPPSSPSPHSPLYSPPPPSNFPPSPFQLPVPSSLLHAHQVVSLLFPPPPPRPLFPFLFPSLPFPFPSLPSPFPNSYFFRSPSLPYAPSDAAPRQSSGSKTFYKCSDIGLRIRECSCAEGFRT